MTGIVITGMHRSGTSVTTQLLSAGGWHPGESLLMSESEQYAEDAIFVALHQRWLETCLPEGAAHRDWGVSVGAATDLDEAKSSIRHDLIVEAGSFVEQRERERARWVAKDPRASLFLTEWGEIESLQFLLVYRNPWDVVDSAIRLGAEVFCRQPKIALNACLEYNRRIAEFATAQRERCIVIAAERIALDPNSVWDHLDAALGLDGDIPDGLVALDRFVRRDDEHPIAELYRQVHPEHCSILKELDQLADLPRVSTEPVFGRKRAVPSGTLSSGTGVQAIICCRDDGDFLLEAIASVDVSAQAAATASGQDRVELTVVDDGSTDGETLRVLEVLRATGRHVLSLPPTGLAGARTAALAVSKTCAVIPVDADNRLRPPLMDVLDLVEKDEVDIVYGSWQCFGMNRTLVKPPMMTLDALVPGNSIDACALVSRDLLNRLGGWNSALPYWEDWDLWLGAVSAGARVRRIDSVTFDYLVRPDSLSAMAHRDPIVRERVVETITSKHADLLGLTLQRLIVLVHRLDASVRLGDEMRIRLEQSYRTLEAHHEKVASAYSDLEIAYRKLEDLYLRLSTQL